MNQRVIVCPDTTLNPLERMGYYAGVCWGGSISDKEKNIARGKECLESGHFRVAEFAQIYLIIEGFSTRCIRELYTHIGGLPTRLQTSTRYVNYNNFEYIIPRGDEDVQNDYIYAMENIADIYNDLLENGVSKEDAANILPLGMETKIVIRTNARQLIDMSHHRDCSRAYWEMRELMKTIEVSLKEYSDDWYYIVDNYCMPKCKVCGFCTEKKCCGLSPKKEDFFNTYKLGCTIEKYIKDLPIDNK